MSGPSIKCVGNSLLGTHMRFWFCLVYVVGAAAVATELPRELANSTANCGQHDSINSSFLNATKLVYVEAAVRPDMLTGAQATKVPISPHFCALDSTPVAGSNISAFAATENDAQLEAHSVGAKGTKITGLGIHHRTAIDGANFVRVDRLQDETGAVDPRHLGLFANDDNVIFVEDTHSIVVNWGKLNTARRVSGIPFTRHISRAKEAQRLRVWVEVLAPDSTTVVGRTQSICGCSHQHHGSGGAVAGTFSSTVGEYSTFDLPFAITVIEAWGASYSTTVKSQFTVSGTYSCPVPEGHSGQLLMSALHKRVDNAVVRHLTVARGLFSRVVDVEVGEWEPVGGPVYVPLEGVEPAFECVVGRGGCEAPAEWAEWPQEGVTESSRQSMRSGD